MQKSIAFHLTHNESPQLSPRWWLQLHLGKSTLVALCIFLFCKVNGPEKMCQAFALCNVSSYVVNPIASKSQATNVSRQDFLLSCTVQLEIHLIYL